MSSNGSQLIALEVAFTMSSRFPSNLLWGLSHRITNVIFFCVFFHTVVRRSRPIACFFFFFYLACTSRNHCGLPCNRACARRKQLRCAVLKRYYVAVVPFFKRVLMVQRLHEACCVQSLPLRLIRIKQK